eukprot:ANDGO_08463.mRNA.1 hypothetical protein
MNDEKRISILIPKNPPLELVKLTVKEWAKQILYLRNQIPSPVDAIVAEYQEFQQARNCTDTDDGLHKQKRRMISHAERNLQRFAKSVQICMSAIEDFVDGIFGSCSSSSSSSMATRAPPVHRLYSAVCVLGSSIHSAQEVYVLHFPSITTGSVPSPQVIGNAVRRIVQQIVMNGGLSDSAVAKPTRCSLLMVASKPDEHQKRSSMFHRWRVQAAPSSLSPHALFNSWRKRKGCKVSEFQVVVAGSESELAVQSPSPSPSSLPSSSQGQTADWTSADIVDANVCMYVCKEKLVGLRIKDVNEDGFEDSSDSEFDDGFGEV